MRKWGDMLVDFILNDSDNQAQSHLANTLVVAEGFSVKRAELESKEFLQICKTHDSEALRHILESGIPSLRLYAARELAVSGDVEAIPALLGRLEKTRTEQPSRAYQTYRAALSNLINRMTAMPQPEHLPYYLDLLRWQKRYQLPIKPLVKALMIIADIWPSPELREALPLLRNYPEARKAIEAALPTGAQLPIPAERSSITENLPRPAVPSADERVTKQLPVPSEAPAQETSRPLWKRLLGKG
ncbi:MAG: hypothetical protein QM758_28000 [Armatimonas sp.]